MADERDKKYYWLRLKRDFFKRHDIQIIEGMPNGKDYVLFYLKLLVESVDHSGELRFSDTIPYNEQMLATITNTNIDVVRTAMKIFVEDLKIIEILSDQTIYLSDIEKMIGSETYWAEKKRNYREKLPDLGQCPQNVLTMSEASPTCPSKSLDIEIEKDIDKDIKDIVQQNCTVKVSKADINTFFEAAWKLYPNKKGKGQISDAKKKKLFDIGLEKLSTAIWRYQEELDKEEWRKLQNGSTFFNSGYLDYLDGNYTPSDKKEKKPQENKHSTNKFNNHPTRDYTAEKMSEIERKLLGIK